MTAAILRKRIRSNFVQIPNETIRDQRLSYKAVGVLAHILSLPDGSPISAEFLANGHTDGRSAVLSALRELTDAGYYRVDRVRGDSGLFRMEVQVSNFPDLSPESGFRTPDNPESGGPESGDPPPRDKHQGEHPKKEKENTLALTLDEAPAPPDLFDDFWKTYPRKTGKASARAAWAKATKTTRPEVILTGLVRNLPDLRSREPQYVPHAATWLNGARWDDEPPPPTRRGPSRAAEVSYPNTTETGTFDVDPYAHRRNR